MNTKIVSLIWLIAAASIAYPAAIALYPVIAESLVEYGVTLAQAPTGSAISLLLPLSFLIVLAATRNRFRTFGSYGLRNAVITLAIWSITTVCIWIVLSYLAGNGNIVGRVFALVVSIVLACLFSSTFIPKFIGVMAGISLAAGFGLLLAIPRVYFPIPSAEISEFINNGKMLTFAAFFFSAIIAFFILRTRLRFEGGWGRQALITGIWVITLHGLWVLVLFVISPLSLLPIWLPLSTGSVMVLSGIVLPLALLYRSGEVDFSRLTVSPAASEASSSQVVLTEAPRRHGRCAWIISYTGVSNEPRVLRQAEALLADRWDVVVCGFDGHSTRPADWNFVRLPSHDAYRSSFRTLLHYMDKASRQLLRIGGATGPFAFAAHFAHSSNPHWLHIRRSVVALAKERPDLKADLVIAHDYHTSDVGAQIARIYEAKFSIDVHEYAREQYSNDPAWVAREQPVIIAVQDYYLRRADVVTVVCEGIADLIAAESPLRRPPVVIRNVPFKNVQGFRPVGEKIKVLYHGDLSRPREIHTAIASLPLWREEFELVLRGGGDPTYVGELKRLAEKLGVEGRITFEASVPFERIVPAANTADIGFFSYAAYSPQIRFALPNKIFEYVMAGLAICVTDLEEVGRVVNRYGNGKLIVRHSAEGIAATINSFTREEIEACKRASIVAAGELNWEVEREKLLDAYRQIVTA